MRDHFSEWAKSALFALLGVVGIAAFYEIEQTVIGRHIGFGGTWGESPRSELYFWLGTAFLLLPGAGLLAWGVLRLGHTATMPNWVEERRSGVAAVCAIIGAFGFALLNRFVLLGLPFTDDEWGARFGGELLARGRVTTEVPEWFTLAPDLFLYVRDGVVTSFDWLGAMVPWAIGSATGLDGLVFSLAAGATLGAVVWTCGQRWGGAWGLAAGALFVASPMALSLSATTHTHVWSRCWLAVAIALFLAARGADRRVLWVLAGAAGGVAWITRPLEVTLLLAPLVLLHVSEIVRRDRDDRAGLVAFLGAGAVFVALFVAHDLLVTGTVFPARLAGNNELQFGGAEHYSPPLAIVSDWELLRTRFGANFAYNLMMLGVYGLSLPGLVLAAIGVRDRVTGALAVGLAACFGLALLHDDYGLHMVGPIHYADAFIPFLLLVMSGLHRLTVAGAKLDLPAARWAAAFVVAMLVWGAVFSSEHLRAIKRQAHIHDDIYTLLDAHPNALVLADPYYEVWRALPDRGTGTYVYDWRKDFGTPGQALVARWSPDDRALYPVLFEAFPQRNIYRLRTEDGELRLEPFPRDPRGL